MNFYNDNDSYVAKWLGNLIEAGHLPQGTVDARSITELDPVDLRSFRQCHFFAGIGGWPYALGLAGWASDREIWSASCPCQPFSSAGQRRGHADERHLWPALYRLIAERRPAVVIGEQVASKDGFEWLAGVRADLEAEGYAVGAANLAAAGAGAFHIRQRLFWVAHALGGRARARQRDNDEVPGVPETERQDVGPDLLGRSGGDGDLGYAGSTRLPAREPETLRGSGRRREGRAIEQSGGPFWADAEWIVCRDGKARPIEPGTFPLVTRLPEGMGSDRPGEASPFRVIRDPKTGRSIGQAPSRVGMLRGYGNSIVPLVAAEFIKAFIEVSATPVADLN